MAWQTKYKTTLAEPLSSWATSIVIATAPTATSWSLKITQWNIEEWVYFTWVSWTTLTWVTRSLSKTASTMTSTWSWEDFVAWAEVKMVLMHWQLIDKTEATQSLQEAKTYADTTARDTALWWDWAATEAYTDVYTTAEWLHRNYNLSSNQWESVDTWTTTPNASTTAAGKVELATDAEVQSETDTWWTWASLWVLPSQTNPSIKTAITTLEEADTFLVSDNSDSDKGKKITLTNLKKEINTYIWTAWEDITVWEAVRKWTVVQDTDITQSSWSSTANETRVWYDTTYQSVWQSFTVTWTKKAFFIDVYMSKAGTPTWNLACKIYSWVWSSLVATSTNTIAESWTDWASTAKRFIFSEEELTTWTYSFEVYTDRANSTSNYIWLFKDTDLYAWWQAYTISSTPTWTAFTWYDLKFEIYLWTEEDTTKIYLASWVNETYSHLLWFAQENVTSWNTFKILTTWIEANQSWLTNDELYYLSDTPWAISTTAWTYELIAWRSISTTEVLINTGWWF